MSTRVTNWFPPFLVVPWPSIHLGIGIQESAVPNCGLLGHASALTSPIIPSYFSLIKRLWEREAMGVYPSQPP